MSAPRLSGTDILFIGLGGIFGSVLRSWIGHGYEGIFHVPTIAVNIIGASALAILYGSQHKLHPQGHHLYMVGFCGSFTTVSLFSHETIQLFENGQVLLALANVVIPVAIALALVAWIVPHAEESVEEERT